MACCQSLTEPSYVNVQVSECSDLGWICAEDDKIESDIAADAAETSHIVQSLAVAAAGR